MLRPANPTDALALLPLQLRAAPNEARSGAALGKPPALLLPLGSLAAEWLPHRRRRHAWVLSRRGVPVGVVGIRMRAGGSCWEVDRLHVARNREEDAVDLLEEAAAAAGGLGAHRVFLRLSVDSRADAEARAANFHVCSTDDLYYRPKGPSAVSANGHVPARPARAEDLHDLFRVYLRAFLGRARQAEGLTLAQWADERSAPAPERRMLVYESGGEIVGYAEVSPAGGRSLIEIVTVPGADGAFERLLDAAVGVGERKDLLLLLSPEHAGAADLAERSGFRRVDSLRLYVKRLAVRVSHPGLIAVGA